MKFEPISFFIGIILVVVLTLAYVNFVSPITLSGQGQGSTTNIDINVPNQPEQQEEGQPEVVQTKPDLLEVFLPYLYVFDTTTECTNHMGLWKQTSTDVGCYNMATPINTATCSSYAYLSAAQQCSAVGGTPVCNANNIGCHY